MVISRWITNLESRESLEIDRDRWQARVDADGDDRQARAMLDAALARLIGHDATMDLIKREHKTIGIGDPQGTEYRTAEAIKADGYIGIYRT